MTNKCVLIGGIIYCQCGDPSSHYGTMGERGAREVRCEAPPTAQAPSKDQVSYLLAKLCWHTCTCQNPSEPSVQHGVYCPYEQARASMPAHEPPPAASKELFEAWLNTPGPATSPDNPYTVTLIKHLYEAWCAAWNARTAHEPPQASREPAYRDALARIRQVCRSDAKDFEAATLERRQVYDIANITLNAHGDLYASGHEPPAGPEHGATLRTLVTAVKALGAMEDGKTLFESSPAKSQAAFDAWLALNQAIAKADYVLANASSQPPAIEPPAEPSSDELKRKLAAAGVFKGFEGLEGLLNSQPFWDEQSYGTRIYYGPGITEYLHRDVLRQAVEILKTPPASAPPPVPDAPTWTCPNCETIDEFTVTHQGPDETGAVYPVMICKVCDTTVSDFRAERIREMCQKDPAIRLALTNGGEQS